MQNSLKLFLVLFITLFATNKDTSGQTPREKFTIEECKQSTACLKEEFYDNKMMPEKFESACLLALSYYPELKREKISFVYTKGAYSMAARPDPFSLLFSSRKNRQYYIYINTESKNKGLLLSDIPFNAQVGIVGHELAHILYYTKTSSWRIILDGILYYSKSFRAKFEQDTDKVAIDRGLGWQVYDFCSKTHKADHVPEVYKQYKLQIYMSPESIIEYIHKQP
ncbi:MAG: hypothetical protein H0V01_04320 [Bacteroidetes bacterium]|nr:hypothetical protein [Bacteroidota bacterium]HET6245315.1 hypothetical protein [Bacteroidia bacterium]